MRASLRKMTQYQIEIVSDVVCPWCYVGKQRLDRAIAQHRATHPEDQFTTTWKPFLLNPSAPRHVDKEAYYIQKFGQDRTRLMQGHLARLGREVGIEFAFGGKTGNTRDAHRLIQLGKTKGEAVQTRLVEELFRAYFEINEDITDPDVLIASAVKAGLDEDETRKWMDEDQGGGEVDREVADVQRKLMGVPSFTVNGKYELQGAEEPSAFLHVFEEIKTASAQTPKLTSGITC